MRGQLKRCVLHLWLIPTGLHPPPDTTFPYWKQRESYPSPGTSVFLIPFANCVETQTPATFLGGPPSPHANTLPK